MCAARLAVAVVHDAGLKPPHVMRGMYPTAVAEAAALFGMIIYKYILMLRSKPQRIDPTLSSPMSSDAVLSSRLAISR